MIELFTCDTLLIVSLVTPPARRAWRSYKFAFSVFFSMSETGLPLMGDTADWQPHEHIVKSLSSFSSRISQQNAKYCRFCRIQHNVLNLFSCRIFQQNTHFNMYTETSKQQQGSPCKSLHPKCFKTTNFSRFHRAKYTTNYVVSKKVTKRFLM